ncbi:G kinase-anchoring protein 1-like isoform X1 [Pieris brassicae]|uniref:G kinase-anchoring protein 1-like isoform X1 n=1 Tax=Pieris brassicae TaxID=7116 RepID=UPI001E65FED9|nr:G kinase-anchoring protein 1-like isoform X1 [Pieris brassicae]XP_045512099.1 G kinase-anchoring protein 1-like isoform X1 [Pieris brassicae]
MAAVVVQSRFAGLKIEDDETSPNEAQKTRKNKTNIVKKIEPAKKPKSTNNNNNKLQAAPKKRKPKPSGATSEQWEMWKQKDEELVHGNYESELQQAILLSKLDYEEKKIVYKQLKKDADAEKKAEPSRNGNKKNKKKTVMSLEQFNDMGNTEEHKISNEEKNGQQECQVLDKDTKFFERIQDETKHELLKDKIIERVRNQTVPDEIINRVQYIEALEKKDKEITGLKQEVTRLKEELLTVKSRNKKLCNILGQGEMKDKAEVLVEVERLRAVQAELNAELASLHSELEKERSKNADPRTKDKKHLHKRKNIQFDVSSEALLTKEKSATTV